MDGLRITGTIFRRLAIVVLLGATFVASAMLTVYALFHSGQVTVPNVVGMSQEEAQRTVERAGLAFKTRRVHFDPQAPQGSVTDQDPSADLPVKSGFEVKVDVSKGVDPTGASEPEPELPGPTNPAEQPKNSNAPNTNRKPRKPTNANANTNAAPTTNAKPPATDTEAGPNKNAPKPGETKPPTSVPDAAPKPKPKPPAPKPPPPAR